MTYFISEVNGLDDDVAETLRDLQKAILPVDVVMSPEDSLWWLVTVQGDLAHGRRTRVPIGFCALKASEQEPGGGFLALSGILPTCRGSGLQRRLIRVRERRARRFGWHTMITYTAPYNYASSNNLIAEGYRLYKPHTPYGLNGALYWRKRLR